MKDPIIKEFDGKIWISSDHHITAVNTAYDSGKAVGAKAERQRLHDKFMEMHDAQKHRNNYWHFAARQILEAA